MKTTDGNMIKKLRKIEDDKDREIISGRPIRLTVAQILQYGEINIDSLFRSRFKSK